MREFSSKIIWPTRNLRVQRIRPLNLSTFFQAKILQRPTKTKKNSKIREIKLQKNQKKMEICTILVVTAHRHPNPPSPRAVAVALSRRSPGSANLQLSISFARISYSILIFAVKSPGSRAQAHTSHTHTGTHTPATEQQPAEQCVLSMAPSLVSCN